MQAGSPAEFIVGTCTSMCPEQDALDRQKNGLLFKYETTDETRGTIKLKVDLDRAVTPYQRSAAGMSWHPDKIRTPETLRKTVRYLMDKILTQETYDDRRTIYEFVFDRLRAVRQELVIQQANADIRREIYELAVLFYASSIYKLTDLEGTDFDPADNKSHLNICLTQLLDIYDTFDRESDAPWSIGKHPRQYSRRCLIESIRILFDLEPQSWLFRYGRLAKDIREHYYVAEAFKICQLYVNNRFATILKRSPKMHFLQHCIMWLHVPKFSMKALARLNASYATRNSRLTYPLIKLSQLLFPSQEQDRALKDTKRLCVALDIEYHGQTVYFSKDKEIKMDRYPEKFKRNHWSGIPQHSWVSLVDEFFRNPQIIKSEQAEPTGRAERAEQAQKAQKVKPTP